MNLVANNLENQVKVEVLINGNDITKEQAGSDVQFEENKTFIIVDKPQLYNLVYGNYGEYELRLKVKSNNFTFNSFTFG